MFPVDNALWGLSEKNGFTVSSGAKGTSQPRKNVVPEVARTCHHGALQRKKKEPVRNEAAERKKAEQIKILQVVDVWRSIQMNSWQHLQQ